MRASGMGSRGLISRNKPGSAPRNKGKALPILSYGFSRLFSFFDDPKKLGLITRPRAMSNRRLSTFAKRTWPTSLMPRASKVASGRRTLGA